MSAPWPTTTIGDLFDIGAGKSVTPASRGQEPKRPFLRTSNVLWGRFDLTDVDTMFFTDAEFAAKNLRSGDLLVCEGGDIGRAAVWQGQFDECSFQNHLHRLRPKRPDISPEFYQFALEGGITLFGLIEGVGNRTTIPNLSRNRLAELAVPLPPIDEQRKIAAVLGKVQAAVAVEGDLVRVARELKQAALRQLFTRGLRNESQKQTTIGPVPESWEVVPFSKFVTLQRGADLIKGDFREGTVPVIGATRIIGYHDIANVRGPGVTVVRSGSSAGKAMFIPTDFWAHNVVLYVKDFQGNDPSFTSHWINLIDLTRFRAGVAVPTLNRNSFENEPVPLPAPAEQREIAAMLATLDAKIAHHEARQALLRELFRTLLDDLLTARRRVSSLDLAHLTS
ncbi:MAG: restriction endonuclease subunit S [Verrucomicrobia bacterium]|nr:restriction endonuclease subunit S [Verrucomicrobiota bacterium]